MALEDGFNEVGYPKDNQQIRDHMKEMVEIGERHPHIQETIKSLEKLRDMLKKVNASPASELTPAP